MRLKVIAIFIAYNAAKTLEKFYREFPKELVDEIILVDDKSKDDTFEIAKKLGIKSYQNSTNLGYGGNLKRAITIALKRGGDILIDIHPDGEYKPSAIKLALDKIINEKAEFVLGNRFTSFRKVLESGMHLRKIIFIVILNLIDRLLLGTDILDLHQGFRVYSRKMLEKINYKANSNTYLFSFEIIAQVIFVKIPIAQVPVEISYTGNKRGASFINSIIYSLGTFRIIILFLFAKIGLKVKIFKN